MSASPGKKRGSPPSPKGQSPLGPEAVEEWFDLDGRLVKEAAMRKALFEGTDVLMVLYSTTKHVIQNP